MCKVVGGSDPLVLSEDRNISHHEEFHSHEHLHSRSIIYFSIRNGLEGQDGSLCAHTNADVGRDSSLRKIWS